MSRYGLRIADRAAVFTDFLYSHISPLIGGPQFITSRCSFALETALFLAFSVLAKSR
jgi:hypothetical protein